MFSYPDSFVHAIFKFSFCTHVGTEDVIVDAYSL